MKGSVALLGGLAGALLLGLTATEAAQLDLTGTWEGTAACHGMVEGTLPASGPIDITLQISPNLPILNVCIDLDRTDLNDELNGSHRYRGTFFPKSATSKTSHGTLTAKNTAISAENLSGAVGSYTSSFNKLENLLKLKGSLISGDGTSAIQCTFKNLLRTSTNDPGTPCPE